VPHVSIVPRPPSSADPARFESRWRYAGRRASSEPRAHGTMIPRDADAQAAAGTPAGGAFSGLRPAISSSTVAPRSPTWRSTSDTRSWSRLPTRPPRYGSPRCAPPDYDGARRHAARRLDGHARRPRW